MPTFDIVCLANSRKYSGRCVAGLRIDGKGWIRPVARDGYGELRFKDYRFTNNDEVRVFDRITIDVVRPQPLPYQPENWQISRRRWTLLTRPIRLQDYAAMLRTYITTGPDLLGNSADRVDAALFDEQPAAASLTLATPRHISFYPKINRNGNRQIRACFSLKGADYDLAVTDPLCEQRLRDLQPGDMLTQTDVLLTISLGELFYGFCYKLVAAIIQL